MTVPFIPQQEVSTLKQFYDLMAATKKVRQAICTNICSDEEYGPELLVSLKNVLGSLHEIPFEEARPVLYLDTSRKIHVDLEYEIQELEKDIHYLEYGEDSFLQMLEELHTDFSLNIAKALDFIGDKSFNCLIIDRDGTVNNYCGRYRSSIQSVYNAIFLTRFARSRVQNPIFMTSAPLADGGILDVSVNPLNTFIYAASKGREYVTLEGERKTFPIQPEKQSLLDRLNHELEILTKDGRYEKFTLIGSGLQQKFGQTTIARQDISHSIPEDESEAFLERIEEIVLAHDPYKHFFHIEDTGLDVEIILTIENAKGDTGGMDFSKADGVHFLNKNLELDMAHGPHLVCGDTASDLPMVQAAMDATQDTFAIFVTKNEALSEKLSKFCPQSITLPQPDMLVTAFGKLGI